MDRYNQIHGHSPVRFGSQLRPFSLIALNYLYSSYSGPFNRWVHWPLGFDHVPAHMGHGVLEMLIFFYWWPAGFVPQNNQGGFFRYFTKMILFHVFFNIAAAHMSTVHKYDQKIEIGMGSHHIHDTHSTPPVSHSDGKISGVTNPVPDRTFLIFQLISHVRWQVGNFQAGFLTEVCSPDTAAAAASSYSGSSSLDRWSKKQG